MTSNTQNELIQEAAKLRSKLKLLDNVKKEELIKQLEAKEHECLEYRAKLSNIQPLSIASADQKDAPVIELEAEIQ
jgi:hypothetical protein